MSKYRPYEIHLNNLTYFESCFSVQEKLYFPTCSLRLSEEWKKCLDNNYLVGGVLMDLSKAFNCVPLDLLIAKNEAYDIN